MKAAVLHEVETPFVIEDVTLQGPGPGEVHVDLAASGVCHSDWHVVTGHFKRPLPIVLGHEGAGVVQAVGEGVTRTKPGDHVILSWAPDCGVCFYCLNEKPNLCDAFMYPRRNATMLDGTTRIKLGDKTIHQFVTLATFAEQAVVPQDACVPIRKDVPLKVAALVGCAVTTGVGAAMNTAGVRPGENVVVYGCGGVGLNVLQGAALCGAETIIAVDRVPAKMDMAKNFGATHTIMAGDDTTDAIKDLTHGRGADYAFEAIGIPAVHEEAIEALRPGGTLVIVGMPPEGSVTKLDAYPFVSREKTVKGSLYGSSSTRRDFPKLLNLYMAGKLKLDELVSQEYKLEEINEAYEAMLGGEVARGVIAFDN